MLEIKWHGGTSVSFNAGKGSNMVIDPDSPLGIPPKNVTKAAQVAVGTQPSHVAKSDAPYVIKDPGEYEVAGFMVQAFKTPLFAPDQDDTFGQFLRVTTPKGLDVGIVGAAAEASMDAIAENLAAVDILLITVGGGGYCYDAQSAAALVKKVEPSVVIPTTFADENAELKGIPLSDIDAFYTSLGREANEIAPSTSLKINDVPVAGAVTSITQLSITKD